MHITSRLTHPGRVASIALVLGTILAVASGNNMVILLVAACGSCWVVSWLLGRYVLRRMTVRRVFPGELVAQQDATVWLEIDNRSVIPCVVRVQEAHGPTTLVQARVGRTTVGTRWSFPQRGPRRVPHGLLSTTAPFGWVEHQVQVADEVDVLVFPHPLPARSAMRDGQATLGTDQPTHGRGQGELIGFQPYQPGEDPRRIHWALTAKTGVPTMTILGAETKAGVQLTIANLPPGKDQERELSRVAAAINEQANKGRAVGLRCAERGLTLRPKAGATWRRHLLTVLAQW